MKRIEELHAWIARLQDKVHAQEEHIRVLQRQLYVISLVEEMELTEDEDIHLEIVSK